MKKLLIIAMALVVSLFAEDEPFEKSGFLTTEKCAKSGQFTECYLQNFFCGSDGCYLESDLKKDVPLVLYSHDDNIIYKLDTSAIKQSVLDTGISMNGVAMVGEYDSANNVIVVQEFKAPPPPKKSFFKGCL
jgi:thioredoxin-related protein